MLHRKLLARSQLVCIDTNPLSRSLQSAAQELQRQQATDNLKKGLERRPEKEELVGRKCTFFK